MNELDFIKAPGSWPQYPILPVVRRSGTGKTGAGFTWVGQGAVVYLGDIFNLPHGGIDHVTAGLEKLTYNTFEQMLTEWGVD